MGALRERPRVAIAKVLGIVLIALAGAGVAQVVLDDGAERQDRVTQLERAARLHARAAEHQRVRTSALKERVARLERRNRAVSRRNRSLTRALARARRAARD